jgi:hypothetical protein
VLLLVGWTGLKSARLPRALCRLLLLEDVVSILALAALPFGLSLFILAVISNI